MRFCILLSLFAFVVLAMGGCGHAIPEKSNLSKVDWIEDPLTYIDYCIQSHDSLFEAAQYDQLADRYTALFREMPINPPADKKILRRELLRIVPLFNHVLRETGQYESVVQLLDSIRQSRDSFLSGYFSYALVACEARFSLMTDDNERTESLANRFAALPNPDDPSVVMFCCHMVAWAYHFSSVQPQADSRMQERAVAAYRQGGTVDDVGAILARLGYFYRREGRYKRAVDMSQEAIQWYEKNPTVLTDSKVRAYADIAALYKTLFLYDKALESNAKAIELSLACDSNMLYGMYRARASFFIEVEQADSALFYLDKEMEVARKLGGKIEYSCRRDVVKYWLQMCPDSNAVALREMTTYFADSIGVRPATHSANRYWLGVALMKNGQIAHGLPLMEQAHREFVHMKWEEMEEFVSKELFRVYVSLQMNDRIATFGPHYMALRDSLEKKDKLLYTAAANVRYETGRKEQENRVLEAELKLRENILTYSWVVVGLLLLLLLFTAIYAWQRRRQYLWESELHRERISRLISIHQNLNRRNELLNEELEKMVHVDVIDNVRQKLNPMLLSGEDELRFRQSFAALYPYYLPVLRRRCPELTKSDELLCILIKLNQSTDEVALALGISRASVNSGRSRIRKKLGLTKEESLEKYLQNVKR